MSKYLVFLAFLLALTTFGQAFAFDQDHSLFTADLSQYVDHGLVHYRSWKKHQSRLKLYLATLAALTPDEYESFSLDQKKALWINAYNALTIKIVLDHYPIAGKTTWYPKNSIRQIDDFWEKNHFQVCGRDVTLYTIMHKIVRSELKDPRLHFVVVPAAKGCLPLRNSAYVAKTLESDLSSALKQFINDPRQVSLDAKKNEAHLSKIFKWFPLDFAKQAGFAKLPFPPPTNETIVLAYVLNQMPPDLAKSFKPEKAKVTYLPYDWSLNDNEGQTTNR